jgi:hypothetical protein
MTKWMRALALGLGTLWAAWWTFFAVASSVGNVIGKEGESFSAVPVMIVLALLVSVVVAWRWPRAGGALFAALGLFLLWASVSFFNNPPTTTWFLVLTLAVPPFIAGLLLLADRWRRGSLGHA